MKKYSCYIPTVLILLLFSSLLLFRGSLIRYASRIMTDGMEPAEKSIVENFLSEQYDYRKSEEGYEYTFLEFGSVGCNSCRQMEAVMEEIKRKYPDRVKVVFVNVSRKENRELVDYFGIVTIPTQVLLNKEGKEYFRHNGYLSADEMAKHFRKTGTN